MEKYNYLTILEKTTQKSGTSYLWKCQCDCGNITYATYFSIKSGHKKSCGCLHQKQRTKLGKSKKKNLLNQTFGELMVIQETNDRKDGRVTYDCLCSCGNIINVSSHNLLSDKKWHCGCQTRKSRGEQKIYELLTINNINFEREKIFPKLGRLRFDFFVNNEFVIEYDGKQHFNKDTGYGKDLENIQKRDQIKNEYCYNNNIPLIRIPYTDYDIFDYKDLFPETSRYLVKGGKNE